MRYLLGILLEISSRSWIQVWSSGERSEMDIETWEPLPTDVFVVVRVDETTKGEMCVQTGGED